MGGSVGAFELCGAALDEGVGETWEVELGCIGDADGLGEDPLGWEVGDADGLGEDALGWEVGDADELIAGVTDFVGAGDEWGVGVGDAECEVMGDGEEDGEGDKLCTEEELGAGVELWAEYDDGITLLVDGTAVVFLDDTAIVETRRES